MTDQDEESGKDFLEFLGYASESGRSMNDSNSNNHNSNSNNQDSSGSFSFQDDSANLEDSINARRRGSDLHSNKKARGKRHLRKTATDPRSSATTTTVSATSTSTSTSTSTKQRQPRPSRKKGAKSPARRTVSASTSSPKRSSGSSAATTATTTRSPARPKNLVAPIASTSSSISSDNNNSDLRSVLGVPSLLSPSSSSSSGVDQQFQNTKASVSSSTIPAPRRSRNRRSPRGSTPTATTKNTQHHGSVVEEEASEHSVSLHSMEAGGDEFHDEEEEEEEATKHKTQTKNSATEQDDQDLELLQSMIMAHSDSALQSGGGGARSSASYSTQRLSTQRLSSTTTNTRTSRAARGSAGGRRRSSLVDVALNMYSSFPGISTRRRDSPSVHHDDDDVDGKPGEMTTVGGFARTTTVDLGVPLDTQNNSSTTSITTRDDDLDDVVPRHSGPITITKESDKLGHKIRATVQRVTRHMKAPVLWNATTANSTPQPKGEEHERDGANKSSSNIDTTKAWKLFGCGFVFVLVVVTVVTLLLVGVEETFGGGKSKQQQQPVMDATEVDSSAAAAAATMVVSTMAPTNNNNNTTELDFSKMPQTSRYDALKFLVQDLGVSNPTSFGDSLNDDNNNDNNKSPQERALVWMSNEDPARLVIPYVDSDGTEEPKEEVQALLQRYALLVFFYGLDPEGQQQQQQQVAVAVADKGTASEEQERANRLQMDTKWGNGEHVCQWPGVTCNAKKSVVALDMPSSRLQGTIPQELFAGAAFPELKSLDLSHNLLHGKLPSTSAPTTDSVLGMAQTTVPLEKLQLNNNRIEGSIDDALEGLSELASLDLSNNTIRGVLPRYFGDFLALASIKLEANHLSGSIPDQWAALTSLKSLNVGRNKALSGKIPAFLGMEVTRLNFLDLQSTVLKGQIPTSLEHLTGLKAMYLHDTLLTGSMPEGVCFMRFPSGDLLELSSDCGKANGTVTCHCCTDCNEG